jgi:hypothetical protein
MEKWKVGRGKWKVGLQGEGRNLKVARRSSQPRGHFQLPTFPLQAYFPPSTFPFPLNIGGPSQSPYRVAAAMMPISAAALCPLSTAPFI